MIREAEEQRVYLNDNRASIGFYTNKYGPVSIQNLNNHIMQYINKIYEQYGYRYHNDDINKDIDVNGILINTS